MKTKKLTLTLFTAAALTCALFSACNQDKVHSATDGGNVGEVKNSANNEDTTSTLNVASDSIRH